MLFLLLVAMLVVCDGYRLTYNSYSGNFSAAACVGGTLISEQVGSNNTCVAVNFGLPANVFVTETPWYNNFSFPGVYFEISLSGCHGAPFR
jgi:hypothetical protein